MRLDLQFQRLRPLSPWQGAWEHQAGIVARILHPDPKAAGRKRAFGLGLGTQKA